MSGRAGPVPQRLRFTFQASLPIPSFLDEACFFIVLEVSGMRFSVQFPHREPINEFMPGS